MQKFTRGCQFAFANFEVNAKNLFDLLYIEKRVTINIISTKIHYTKNNNCIVVPI